ncbi:MAG: ADP/ATP-dependent (S)-NAD(P)H-hydrate dehydratase, partial [Pseudomonadota bacterium]
MENAIYNTQENSPELWLGNFPALDKETNKYKRGYAFIIGGEQMTGAARLAALSAARVGAGITTIAAPQAAFSIYATSMISILVKPFSQITDLKNLLSDERISAFLVGSGLGVSSNTKEQVLAVLATGKPVIIDSDGLNVFSDDLPLLQESIKSPCVITPHEGEFARLYDFSGDKIARALKAAELINAVVVLKGADTVIAA